MPKEMYQMKDMQSMSDHFLD